LPTPHHQRDELIKEQNLSQLLRFIQELKPHSSRSNPAALFSRMSYQSKLKSKQRKIKLLLFKKLLAEIIRDKR
jgi:RNA polymerase sigma-70 factor (ECF subfamily)